MQKERIAIIGVGCRFPGGVSSKDSLWKLLVEGREGIVRGAPRSLECGTILRCRARCGWKIDRFARRISSMRSINSIRSFLASRREKLPTSIRNIDCCSRPPGRRSKTRDSFSISKKGPISECSSAFRTTIIREFRARRGIISAISPHTPTGSAHSIAANRISYCLNLRGPSVAMDTACSSALTAVHAACEHIWAGRGDAALAGGVTVMITPGGFIGFSQAAMLSPEGRCAAFDASASGFVRGEGAGMVLLKRFSQALADGDPIQGVIVGTSINQDGHTNGISLPSPEAQARLVQDACKDAGIAPELDWICRSARNWHGGRRSD